METYKGFKIRKSGKFLYRIIEPTGSRPFFQRWVSIEAAKVAIDSRGRVMTPAEHAIVYPK